MVTTHRPVAAPSPAFKARPYPGESNRTTLTPACSTTEATGSSAGRTTTTSVLPESSEPRAESNLGNSLPKLCSPFHTGTTTDRSVAVGSGLGTNRLLGPDCTQTERDSPGRASWR